MSDLALSNIINISVSSTPVGLNAYNTSNLALFSSDTPGMTFGDDDYKIYKEPIEVGKDFGTGSVTYKQALATFSQAPNILANQGSLIVAPLIASETLAVAISRMIGVVQFNGIMASTIESQTDMLAAAAVVQTQNKVAAFVQKATASIEPAGSLDLLRTGGFTKSRGLFYGSSTDLDALLMQAAYMGRALSTVFSGSRTTQTMHLKTLATIQPDPIMSQTLFTKSIAAGADTYVSFQGSPGVNCSGANKFFDQVYNLGWFVGDLEISGFNYLKQTSTKIPQTENGMDGLKGAYRAVCEQAVKNLYVAPGKWNSPVTFGVQEDFFANIEQFGYYIYSTPLSEQSQADREARKAPLVQIAIKEAGAVQSSSVIINVNA